MSADNNQRGRRWAWGITGAYVLFAGMTLTMVAVAFSQRTDLVSQDYYQQEIDYQRHIERQARTRSLPEGIAWTLKREDGVLVLRFPRGHFDDGPSGIVSLYRAADAALDQRHTIGLDEFGCQQIPVAGLAKGRWHIRIEWQADGQQYFSEAALTVGLLRMELWTAGLIGLGGSLHCVGMCGPLALALSRSDGGHGAYVAGRLLYNGGRITTYALLGGIFGLLGGVLRLAGWQQGLSIALGVLILLTTILGLAHRRLPMARLPVQLVGLVRTGLSRMLRLQSPAGLYLTGVLNGLLPCGLVYMALAGSLTMDSPQSGVAYMAAFGAGTVPLMLATSLVGRVVAGPSVQQVARTALPAGMLVLGTLFVLRGLGLDIPYVSPILHGAGDSRHH